MAYPPTSRQMWLLDQLGWTGTPPRTRRDAWELIRKIMAAYRAKLAEGGATGSST